jgi:hypothetical protein
LDLDAGSPFQEAGNGANGKGFDFFSTKKLDAPCQNGKSRTEPGSHLDLEGVEKHGAGLGLKRRRTTGQDQGEEDSNQRSAVKANGPLAFLKKPGQSIHPISTCFRHPGSGAVPREDPNNLRQIRGALKDLSGEAIQSRIRRRS